MSTSSDVRRCSQSTLTGDSAMVTRVLVVHGLVDVAVRSLLQVCDRDYNGTDIERSFKAPLPVQGYNYFVNSILVLFYPFSARF